MFCHVPKKDVVTLYIGVALHTAHLPVLHEPEGRRKKLGIMKNMLSSILQKLSYTVKEFLFLF
jgi:hypothetical protein